MGPSLPMNWPSGDDCKAGNPQVFPQKNFPSFLNPDLKENKLKTKASYIPVTFSGLQSSWTNRLSPPVLCQNILFPMQILTAFQRKQHGRTETELGMRERKNDTQPR